MCSQAGVRLFGGLERFVRTCRRQLVITLLRPHFCDVLVHMVLHVADLVEAAKIRWIERKVEEMENKYDPRGAWRAMREISAMFAGHIKSAVTMRMRKKDGTIATTDEENGRVLCEHFD